MKIDNEQLELLLGEQIKDRGYEGGVGEFYIKESGVWRKKNIDNIPNNYYAITIIQDFNLDSYIKAIFAWYTRLDADDKQFWYRSFTKNIFLFGNIEKIKNRFNELITYADERVCFVDLKNHKRKQELSRLLPKVETFQEYQAHDVVCDAHTDQPKATLYIATEGLKLEEYLIHITHILVESLLLNHINNHTCLTVHHVAKIPAHIGMLRHRIDIDTRDPSTLKCYAAIARD